MPFKVSFNIGSRPTPQIKKRSEVIARAKESGSANAAHAYAVTVPNLDIDRRGLYSFMPPTTKTMFRTDAQLILTLSLAIYIAKELAPSAQRVWAKHEQKHVTDYQRIMRGMEAAIRKNQKLKRYDSSTRWFPYSSYKAADRLFESEVEAIFTAKVKAANKRLDTTAGYTRIYREMLAASEGPYFYKVGRGDTLSKIARFYYGKATLYPIIHDANRRVIGSNPNRISPGQKLVIPKKP